MSGESLFLGGLVASVTSLLVTIGLVRFDRLERRGATAAGVVTVVGTVAASMLVAGLISSLFDDAAGAATGALLWALAEVGGWAIWTQLLKSTNERRPPPGQKGW